MGSNPATLVGRSRAVRATHGDEVLVALSAVVDVLEGSRDSCELVQARAQALRHGRSRGASYAELLTSADGPLVVEVVTNLLDGLFAAGSRFRRAEARALHAEGLSMDKISRLLRVSRQRVSALIRSPAVAGAGFVVRDPRRSRGLSLTDPEFRMIADSIPHIVWVSGPDGTTEYFNRQGGEYAGLPSQTRVDGAVFGAWFICKDRGWEWVSLVHPDDRERARRAWEHAVRTEGAFELNYRIRRDDGEFRWHCCRSLPVRGSDGNVAKWIGTATDIEGEKRVENARRPANRTTPEAPTLVARREARCLDRSPLDAKHR